MKDPKHNLNPYPRYRSADGERFLVINTWCPNEEPDTWVTFRKESTGEEYTCRHEAFLARYSPLAD